jgi:hypothetical protein
MEVKGWLPSVQLVVLSTELPLMTLLVLKVALPYRGVFLVSSEHPYQIVSVSGVRRKRIRNWDWLHRLYLIDVPVFFVSDNKTLKI